MSIYKNLSEALGIEYIPSSNHIEHNETNDDFIFVPGAFVGQKHTEESKQKIREALQDVPKTEEHKQKLRVTKPRTQCPHCLLIVDVANSKRWHFDNCPTYTGIPHPKQTLEHKEKRCKAGALTRTGQKKAPHSEATKEKMRGPRGPNIRTKDRIICDGGF